jgi:hypothetical protein
MRAESTHSPVAGSNSEGFFFLVGTYYEERLSGTFYDYEDIVARLQAAETSAAHVFERIRKRCGAVRSPWMWVEITSNTYCNYQALVI